MAANQHAVAELRQSADDAMDTIVLIASSVNEALPADDPTMATWHGMFCALQDIKHLIGTIGDKVVA